MQNVNANRRMRVREGFTERQILKLIETCGKTLNEEDLNCPDHDKYSKDSNCSICLGEWGNHQRVIEFKKCPHSFHADCLKDWLKIKNTCPLCKMNKKEEIGITEDEYEPYTEEPGLEELFRTQALQFNVRNDRYLGYFFP